MKYYFLEETGSTNLHASALLSATKEREPFCVVSNYQTGGKGQGENKWVSGKKLNILLSYVVFPEFLHAGKNFFISMISALSIADILEKEISDISIKWPNDVLAGRKKIAGILIENSIMADRIRHSIIGIGINVNQKKYPFFQPQATSIKLETGRHSDTNVLITDLENAFIKWYNLLASNNHDMIRQSYYQLLAGFNVSMHYRDLATNKSFPAIIKGVNEDGRLVLINDQGETLSYGFREIEMQL